MTNCQPHNGCAILHGISYFVNRTYEQMVYAIFVRKFGQSIRFGGFVTTYIYIDGFGGHVAFSWY